MSKLRQKSEFNLDAAELLLHNSLYAPSVHCSYYSCFQLLKFTIKDFFGIDYDNFAANSALLKKKSHQYVIDYVVDELVNFTNIPESIKFKRKIKDLKNFREESDYDDIEVNSDKGNNALTLAKEIRHYLKTNFNV